MPSVTHGIHHVTAIAGSPQKNVDFYSGVLGLRMVKKTINYDDPYTYHLYFGDSDGNPGTIMTFFPWSGNALKGRAGVRQLTTTAFSIPQDSVGYWVERLKKFNVEAHGPYERFDETVITLYDADGIELELVAGGADSRSGWGDGFVPAEKAILGFYSVTLSEESRERTAKLMTGLLGFREVRDAEGRYRLESGDGTPGTIVDILDLPGGRPGAMGVGAVHHVAWRITGDAEQVKLRQELLNQGYNVSPVMDRNYFHSIYFREPGGVLFEVATDPPGFAIDETPATLGQSLRLPPWLEPRREEIETRLPEISLPGSEFSSEQE